MASSVSPGELFADKYRVEATLGKGGMGVVFAAHHVRLDEPVAIKVLLPEVIEVPGMVQRFLGEARAAAKIKSEHVVRVTDVDVIPSSGIPYMVMERLDGTDLNELCKRHNRLPVSDAVRWLLQACEAIAEAHALGIIHRDLKPGNLFLARRRDGTSCIKVLDFGLSKVAPDGPAGEQNVTATGIALGTPSYMSPEQMASSRNVDRRTDIWALGAILYKLLTGLTPFPGSNMVEICTRILAGIPPKAPTALRPEIPPELGAVILRCMERDRERRFTTVSQLMEALQPFVESNPSSPSRDRGRVPSGDHGPGGASSDPATRATVVDRRAPVPPPQPAAIPRTPGLPPTVLDQRAPDVPSAGQGKLFKLVIPAGILSVILLVLVIVLALRQ